MSRYMTLKLTDKCKYIKGAHILVQFKSSITINLIRLTYNLTNLCIYMYLYVCIYMYLYVFYVFICMYL